MIMYKKVSISFLLPLALAACQPLTPVVTEPGSISIEPVITRATEVNFEDGDAIGVSVIMPDGTKYADNQKLVYADKLFSADLKWYEDGGQSSSLLAYYPYSEGGFPSEFSVGSDQSAGAGKYDLMVAAKSEVRPQAAAVTMAFRHQLTQIVMNVTNTAAVEIDKVLFKGIIPTVNLSLSASGELSAAVDPSAQKVDIVAECLSANQKYRAIIAPQTMSFGVSVSSAMGGSVVEQFSEVTMKPGYTYTINAEITAQGVRFSLSGEIQAWDDGGVLNPDDKPQEPAFEEGDGYFVYGGLRYTTAKMPDGKIWMTEPMAYLPAGVTASEDPAQGTVWYPYSSDGSAVTVLKDDASIKSSGYLYSFDALLGTAVTEENWDKLEGAQGICPEGWHVPTRAEWFALCGSSTSSKLLGESGTQTNPDAFFWDSTLGYASVGGFNRGGFNFTLSGCISAQKYNTLIIDSNVCAVSEYFGKGRMTYMASSTPNSQTQYFALMTTFTSTNNMGKVSLAFATLGKCGVQLRCVKNQ